MEEKLLKLVKVLKKESAKRKQSNLYKYNKIKTHQKQIAFHKSLKKNRWVFGGNRSGKTECGAVETVWLARGIHPYKNNKQVSGWVVSLSTQVQRDVAQKKILHYLEKRYIAEVVMISGKQDFPENGVIDYIMVKNVFGGLSKIGFKTIDQGREKFAGSSLDFVWFDEEPTRDVYNECKMRVMDKDGIIFGTMTPLKGLTFIYDEIYLNKFNSDEVWYEFMDWNDNPFLPESAVSEMEKTFNDDELESRKFGKFTENTGMVYSEFDENIHVIEPFSVPKDWQDIISIDPGLNNPLSAHFYCRDYDGNIYVIAEHFEAKKTVDYHAKRIWEIAKELEWKETNQQSSFQKSGAYLETIIDSAANQRTLSGTKTVVELFYDEGIIASTNVNKDLFAGINTVKRYLKATVMQAKNKNFKDSSEPINSNPKLFIFKNCINLIREFKSYFWGNGDSPKKTDDHALDELRYYVMSVSEMIRPNKLKNKLQRHKEHLIKHKTN